MNLTASDADDNAAERTITGLHEKVEKAWGDLDRQGYAVVPDVISGADVERIRTLFFDWFRKVFGDDPDLSRIGPHHIFKYHEVGGQAFMWLSRHMVAYVWEALWAYKTAKDRGEEDVDPATLRESVFTALDGACFIPASCRKKDRCWTHTDQSPRKRPGFRGLQGILALTSNSKRGLVVYPGSHLHHEAYGKTITDAEDSHFLRIRPSFLEHLRRDHGIVRTVVKVNAGSLVLWDSRTFHQNCYGPPGCKEARFVVYTSMDPVSSPANTLAQERKRVKYMNDRRTTAHTPAPLRVNSKQPQTYGDKTLLIDYDALPEPPRVISDARQLALVTGTLGKPTRQDRKKKRRRMRRRQPQSRITSFFTEKTTTRAATTNES